MSFSQTPRPPASPSSFPQGHDEQLHAEGLTGRSLVSPDGKIWLPYDIARHADPPLGLRRIGDLHDARVRCAADANLAIDWSGARTVHILNGAGVALGDNIVGLSVVHELARRYPDLDLVLHPAAHLPAAVGELHQLLPGDRIRFEALPLRLDAIAPEALVIDLGDFAYWPQFDSMPMVDFFAWALGMDVTSLTAETRRNAWLTELLLPPLPAPWQDASYQLFAPGASTPLRAIPEHLRATFVEEMTQRQPLPVLGFGGVAHPAYTDISAWSRNTAEFMAWISHAKRLVSADSAAIHIAAAFDVPTLAGFVSIDPTRRTAGYPHCEGFDLRRPELDGRHHSDEPALLQLAARAWEGFGASLRGKAV